MQGINSFEEIIKKPGLCIINWEFISNHPEAKHAIWQRYQLDAWFKFRINQIRNTDAYFRRMFEKHFASYMEIEQNIERTRGR